MTEVDRLTPSVRPARIAASVIFAVHGAAMATFATRIPWIAERLHTEPGALGFALLFSAIGAMSAMPFAGRIAHHFRTRVLVPTLITVWAFAVVLPSLAPNLGLLCAALFVFGAAAGIADVAMNAQGVAVEQAAGRSLMSGLHGMWSLGALLGSGIGVLAAHFMVDARIHFLTMAVLLSAIAWLVRGFLLDIPPTSSEAPLFALPPRKVVLIALVAFAAVFGEVASSDWAAVYLTEVAQAGPALAAGAFSGFAATMAATRLVGDRIVDRFGPVLTVRVGGLAATVGALTVAFARTPALAIVGFALIGMGVAVVVPLAFTAAAGAGANPGNQIAGVATIAYGAGLAAPASIGGIAQLTSLPVSFIVVAALSALIVVGAPTLRRRAVTGPDGASMAAATTPAA